MKKLNIYLIIFILAFVSCKIKPKETSKTLSNNTKTTISGNLDYEDGDVLLSKIDFIKSIDKSCKRISGAISDNEQHRGEFKNKCSFLKLNYNYDVFRGFEEVKQLYSVGSVNYSLDLNNKNSDSDDFKFVSLYSIAAGKKIDSLIVYSHENYIEALVEKGRHFYLNNNQVYIYEFNEDEEGIHSTKWSKFSIESGKFKLLEAITSF